MKQLLISLLLWISQNTAFQSLPQQPLPDLQVIPASAILRMLYEDKQLAKLTPKELRDLEGDVTAIYDNHQNTIYVEGGIDLDSDYGNAVLVHELVHYLQFAHGADETANCISELEEDAYRIQAKYMEEQEMIPEFDEFTIRMRSICSLE